MIYDTLKDNSGNCNITKISIDFGINNIKHIYYVEDVVVMLSRELDPVDGILKTKFTVNGFLKE